MCTRKLHNSVKYAFDQEVSCQVHSMSAKYGICDTWELKLNGFIEIELQKDCNDLYILSWWLKFCVFGWQNEWPREGYERLLLVFQSAEL